MSKMLFIGIVILLTAYPAMAQTKGTQNNDLLKLKIEELEKTDIKSKSSTVQSIYNRSLLRLYNQYISALEEDIKDLEKIRAATSDTGDAESTDLIAKLLREKDLTTEKLKTLRDDVQTAAASTDAGERSPAADNNASVRPAIYTEVRANGADKRPNAVPAVNTSSTRSILASTASAETGAPRPALPAPAPDDPPGTGTTTPDPNGMEIDWPTRTAGCPPRVTQSSTRTKVHVTEVNDLIIDFSNGARLEYRLRAKGTPVSAVPPENPLLAKSPAGFVVNNAACPTHDQLNAMLRSIRDFVQNNSDIRPPQPGGRSISLVTTRNAALGDGNVKGIRDLLKAGTCTLAGLISNTDPVNLPVLEWIARLDGPHTYDFNIVLEPGQNYEFTLREFWEGQETQGGVVRRDCGENDIFTMSVGPIVSTLPQRTYSHQKALVPPGSTTTQDVLSVGNGRNISVLGAALLNYHFPRFGSAPKWLGLTLSAGPVYTLGDTPGVSPLGLFVGTSIHLNRSVFITPGIHIGQFADFPTGFAPGTVIPDQFGNLNPVKRTTAHFAIGLTYKTNSFKKSTDTAGTANSNNATAGGAGKPPDK